MEEKDRYELIGYCSYRDTETGVISDNFVGLLDEKDQQISDLETKLAESEKKASKKAVKELNRLLNENEGLKQQLAEKERQYETLYKLFSEQHEIIDQNELGCFEEVNRLLKEQKDFYIVEKTEYDKMKQGAKDIVEQLKKQLAEKEKEIETLNKFLSDKADEIEKITCDYERQLSASNILTQAMKIREHNKDKISFAIEQLEKVKDIILNERKITSFKFDIFNKGKDTALFWLNEEIDNQINKLKGKV